MQWSRQKIIALLLLLCRHNGLYCSVRDWTRICYVTGLQIIWIHASTRYQIRCGLFFFPLCRADLKKMFGLAVDLAGCVWTEALSGKLRIQKYPDTCGWGLCLLSWEQWDTSPVTMGKWNLDNFIPRPRKLSLIFVIRSCQVLWYSNYPILKDAMRIKPPILDSKIAKNNKDEDFYRGQNVLSTDPLTGR